MDAVPARCLPVLLLLSLAAGCGGERIDRLAVSGTVTFEGAPLPEGAVTLVPLEDGPSAGATISGGRFSIARERGPAPGRYRVEIVSYQPTGRREPDPDLPGETVEELRQVIPPEFNTHSTLEVELDRETAGRLTFDLP